MSEIANKTILELISLNEYLESDAIPVLRPNLHEDNCIALGNIIWYDKDAKQLIINGRYRFNMSSLIQANISIKLLGDSGITGFTYNGQPYSKGSNIESYEDLLTATIIANVNPHYTFNKWQFDNKDIYTFNPLLYNFTESGELSAITTPNKYTITVTANNAEWGIVSGSGSYGYGTSQLIEATSYDGYHFVKWNDDETINPRNILVQGDATYTAFFESNTSVPTITTSNVSNITQNSAICGGNVTSDGNSAITARGVCWSTSSNPTVEDSHTSDGTDTGSFTSNITGLTLNTTYHVRAYATNSIGTAYGLDKTFKTEDYPDYYIGFYNDPDEYLNATDDELISNARVKSTVASNPNYPSSNDYIYFLNNEKMLYLIYNEDYTVLIDNDNPGHFLILNDQTVDLIHMQAFNRTQITKNNKTYSVLATYEASNTNENGYRFKFSNN